jgi:hypothetical protein
MSHAYCTDLVKQLQQFLAANPDQDPLLEVVDSTGRRLSLTGAFDIVASSAGPVLRLVGVQIASVPPAAMKTPANPSPSFDFDFKFNLPGEVTEAGPVEVLDVQFGALEIRSPTGKFEDMVIKLDGAKPGLLTKLELTIDAKKQDITLRTERTMLG